MWGNFLTRPKWDVKENDLWVYMKKELGVQEDQVFYSRKNFEAKAPFTFTFYLCVFYIAMRFWRAYAVVSKVVCNVVNA